MLGDLGSGTFGTLLGAGLRNLGCEVDEEPVVVPDGAPVGEAIRAAVGDAKLSYLGYSYGTLLGAVYAHLYPGRVRAFVLDGAVDLVSLGRWRGAHHARVPVTP